MGKRWIWAALLCLCLLLDTAPRAFAAPEEGIPASETMEEESGADDGASPETAGSGGAPEESLPPEAGEEGVPEAARSVTTSYRVIGGNIYFNGTTQQVTGCDPDVTWADIPIEIPVEGKYIRVEGIGEKAFNGCQKLEGVRFPGSLTAIGRNAFTGCKALREVIIPGRVTSIGVGAFMDCSR